MNKKLLKNLLKTCVITALSTLMLNSAQAQVDGDMRSRYNKPGQSITGNATYEIYSAATGLWSSYTVAGLPATMTTANTITIRDGISQTSNGTMIFNCKLVIGEGNAATATATSSGGVLTGITVNKPGKLICIPSITIIGSATTGATAVVSSMKVSDYEITNPGDGFTTATVQIGNVWLPSTAYALNNQVSIGGNLYTCVTAGISDATTGPVGTGAGIVDGTAVWNYAGVAATATATVTNAKISALTITNEGSGYNGMPGIVITGGNTIAATAVAKVGVLAINVTAGGSGYTANPTIALGSIFQVGNGSTTRTNTVNGDLVINADAGLFTGGVVEYLVLGGNLILNSNVICYTPQLATNTSTGITFNKAGVATISGTGSLTLRNLTVGASTTLTPSVPINIAGTVSLNTTGNIDATNANVSYITYPQTPIAQVIADNTYLNGIVKNLTINNTSGLTSNQNLAISATLTQQAGIFTIPITKTLKISSGNAIAGSFGSTNYINTASDITTGTVGAMQVENLTGSYLFPIGNNSNYLPVTITPVSSSTFTANVFTGVTDDGTVNGVATAVKTNLVDAVYAINRTVGSGNATLTLGFTPALKGSDFVSNDFGISSFSGGAWLATTGTGNNTANTATATLNAFTPLRVKFNPTVLPISLTSLVAKADLNNVKVLWVTSSEINNDKFVVERSTVGNSFSKIGEVKAQGPSSYSIIDNNPANGTNYYRLIQYDLDGKSEVFGPVAVNFDLKANTSLMAYPNPTPESISFNADGLNGNIAALLLDMSGKVIHQENINNTGERNYTLNMKQKPVAGQYVLQVSGKGFNKSTMIVVL
jgi:hypothetical protein